MKNKSLTPISPAVPLVPTRPRRAILDVYADELDRLFEEKKQKIDAHYKLKARSLNDLSQVLEDGLGYAAEQGLAKIDAAGGCCHCCGHCNDAGAAVEEGDDHGPI